MTTQVVDRGAQAGGLPVTQPVRVVSRPDATRLWIGEIERFASARAARGTDPVLRILHGILTEANAAGTAGHQLLGILEGAPCALNRTHTLNLVCAAIRQVVNSSVSNADLREAVLGAFQRDYANLFSLVETRHHSLTSARRFLIPHLFVPKFLKDHGLHRCALADIGTGIGLLPRQLNDSVSFNQFAEKISWPEGFSAAFQQLPLLTAVGIDRAPFPTLDWVASCFPATPYYQQMRFEFLAEFRKPRKPTHEVILCECDATNSPALAELLRHHRINVCTCNFVFYEMSRNERDTLLQTLVGAVERPGCVLVTDFRANTDDRIEAEITMFTTEGQHAVLGWFDNNHLVGGFRLNTTDKDKV